MLPYIEKITQPLLIQSYTVLFVTSFSLCFVILSSSRYGLNRRAFFDQVAVQSAHEGNVPRIGGLAIYLSILGFIPLSTFGLVPLAIVLDLDIVDMSWLLLSALPVFIVGLAEDLGYSMSPIRRLSACVVSGVLFISVFNVWLSQIGVMGIDNWLSFAPFGIVFTLFATSGVVNAFNLIDGLNGLSSYVTISTAIALSIISFQVDNFQIASYLILLSAAVLGFMVLNFPFGKIFLGDAGAYTLGHILVWSAILLINFDTGISSFAILLIFFWPVADTGLAIWRRWKLGNPTDRPDRLHFHQLAMRYLEIRFVGRGRRKLANSVATLILAPMISAPQILGVYLWDNYEATVVATVLMGLLFTGTYMLGISLAKKSRTSGRL